MQCCTAAAGELVVVEAKLKETRAGLKAVEDRVAELEYNYDTAVQKQTDLQNQVKVTEVKLERANRSSPPAVGSATGLCQWEIKGE